MMDKRVKVNIELITGDKEFNEAELALEIHDIGVDKFIDQILNADYDNDLTKELVLKTNDIVRKYIAEYRRTTHEDFVSMVTETLDQLLEGHYDGASGGLIYYHNEGYKAPHESGLKVVEQENGDITIHIYRKKNITED